MTPSASAPASSSPTPPTTAPNSKPPCSDFVISAFRISAFPKGQPPPDRSGLCGTLTCLPVAAPLAPSPPAAGPPAGPDPRQGASPLDPIAHCAWLFRFAPFLTGKESALQKSLDTSQGTQSQFRPEAVATIAHELPANTLMPTGHRSMLTMFLVAGVITAVLALIAALAILGACVMCCFRRLRFLAPFVLLIPTLAALGAAAGSWGLGYLAVKTNGPGSAPPTMGLDRRASYWRHSWRLRWCAVGVLDQAPNSAPKTAG